jgi:hypothetical protein
MGLTQKIQEAILKRQIPQTKKLEERMNKLEIPEEHKKIFLEYFTKFYNYFSLTRHWRLENAITEARFHNLIGDDATNYILSQTLQREPSHYDPVIEGPSCDHY